MKATKVNAGLAESNGRLLLGIWRDSLHVTCWLTACTPGSAPGPTLGNEYGQTLPLLLSVTVGSITPPRWEWWSIAMSLSVCVCMSACEHISGTEPQFCACYLWPWLDRSSHGVVAMR